MKNSIKITLFLLFFMLIGISSNQVFADSELKLEDLQYEITVNSDGSMDVVETWDIDIYDTGTLYKTFIMDSSKFSDITNVKVKDLTGNINFREIYNYMYRVTPQCYFGLENSSGNFEIAWGVDLYGESDRRKYKIEYTVVDAIAIHGDCAELYWQIIGDEFEVPIEQISGTVTFEGANLTKEDVKVWGHTDSLNGIIEVDEEGRIEFELQNIPTGDMVEIRSVFPSDVIENSGRKDNKFVLDSIIEEETEWANEANIRKGFRIAAQRVISIIVSVIAGLAALFQLITVIKILKNTSPKRKPIIDVDYFRDLPREDATPAEASVLI